MENLTKKNYSKFDRSFMIFGSIMNACQNIITEENKQEIIDWAWKNATEKTAQLVDSLYENNRDNGELPL